MESGKSTEEIIPPEPHQPSEKLKNSLHDLPGKKDSDISQINVGVFHATVERLAGGKEIIRIAQRDRKSGNENNEDIISSLQQVLNGDSLNGETEVPYWLLKVYEKLNGNENNKKQAEWLLNESNSEEKVKRLHQPDEEENIDKIKINPEEINRLLESCENLKSEEHDSNLWRIISLRMIHRKLNEVLTKLKLFLIAKPNNVQENFVDQLTKVKNLFKYVEESVTLLDNESAFGKGKDCEEANKSLCDEKVEAYKKLMDDSKIKIKEFSIALKKLDESVNLVLSKDENLVKNDDIILVEEIEERTSPDVKSSEKDEL